MTVFEQILDAHGGDRVTAGVTVAKGLMAGDPAQFKAGYTDENAALAVRNLYDLDDDQVADVLLRLPIEECGCGADRVGDCCAAVEHAFTSLAQRSDEQLRELADGDECGAAKRLLTARRLRSGS